MSIEFFGLILILAMALLAAGLWAAIWRRDKSRTNKSEPYQWQPEQDYDVIQTGESWMTPPFPKLIKREKKQSHPHETSQASTSQKGDRSSDQSPL